MILTEEQIQDIAEHLDAGFNCYYHIDKKTLVKIPNNDLGDLDEEAWASEIEELEENFMEYRAIDKMTSVESFHMMESYIQSIDDTNPIKQKLSDGILLKKPFRQFKDIIDLHPEDKDIWRAHRLRVMMDFVRESIKKNRR